MIHIGQMIVLAGPRCVGKSWLIERIQKESIPIISKPLGLDNPSSWKIVNANQAHTLTDAVIEKLLLHYNFLAPWQLGFFNHEKYEELDILEASNEITFATIWTPPEILIRRLKKREWRVMRSLLPGPGFRARLNNLNMLKKIHRLYLSRDLLLDLYNQWLEFCATYSCKANWMIWGLEGEVQMAPISNYLNMQQIQSNTKGLNLT